jgi:hypothetical protein
MLQLIDGVVHYLPRATSEDAEIALGKFKERATKAHTKEARSRIHRELESYLESTPQLRDAAERYLTPKIVAALEDANIALKKAHEVLRGLE